jgi:hypothetical protein
LKKQFLTLLAIGGMVLGLGGAMNSANTAEAEPLQFGGAAGLIAAVVQVQVSDVEVYDVVDVRNVNVLNNSLNNNNILNDLEVNVLTGEDAIDVFLTNILTDFSIDVLNDLNIESMT